MAGPSDTVDTGQTPPIYPRGRQLSLQSPPSNEDLLEMVLALASEVSVLRDRLDTHERLAKDGNAADLDAVEAFIPDDDAFQFRSEERQRTLSKVLRVVRANFAEAIAQSKTNAAKDEKV